MSNIRKLNWPLIAGLGAAALIRPLARIVQSRFDVPEHSAVPIVLTVIISLVWILVVGLGRTPAPVMTLAFVGLIYGVLAIVLSGPLSLVLDGRFDGPLAHPAAIVPMLSINVLWGLLAGHLARAVQRVRAGRTERAGKRRDRV